jgi:anti-sigma factor RsiW
MQHPDEGTIHSWLDGELSPAEASEMATHVNECVECGARVAEARGLIAASTRILTALDDVPGNVAPTRSAEAAVPGRRQRWYDRTDLRAAAAIALVAGVSLVAVRSSRNGTGAFDSGTIASQSHPVGAAVMDSAVVPLKAAPIKTITPSVESHTTAAPARRMEELKSSNSAAKTMTAQTPPAAMPLARAAAPTATGAPAPRAIEVPQTVVTAGVASAADESSVSTLRLVRVDSIGASRRSVYEVSPGVEVTLIETPSSATTEKDFSRRVIVGGISKASTAAGSGGNATASSAMAVTKAPPVNSITWNDATHSYTLIGPMTREKLEALKERLMQMSR